MGCSRFKRCGNGFRCTSKKPLGKILYDQIVESQGPAYQHEVMEGPVAGRAFALAMMAARANSTLDRAAEQADPLKVYDLLLAKEREYGLTPDPDDTIRDRRDALAAKMRLSVGPRRANVEYQLASLLGDDFVAWVTTPSSSGTAFPPTPWVTSGIFKNPPLWKTIRITPSIAFTGSPLTVAWTHEAGDDGAIVVGDALVVAPGELGQQELVIVTARTNTTLTTTFSRPHEAGAMAIRRPWPFWMSHAKHSAVVVRNGRASDRVLRKKVFRLLHSLLGATSTWDVVDENASPGTSGPMIPGAGTWFINRTPLGALST